MTDKIYVFSGIPPHPRGVGDLLLYLSSFRNNSGITFEFVVPHSRSIYTSSTRSPTLLKRAFSKGIKIFDTTYFKLKTAAYRQFLPTGQKILLLHPQSLGWDYTLDLIQNNDVYFYVMDNSFFCINSRNYIRDESGPCLRCLNNGLSEAKRMGCKPIYGYDLEQNVQFLEILIKLHHRITFLTQNINQEKLIRKWFEEPTVYTIGLRTSSMYENILPATDTVSYDFVYHGSRLPAKGIVLTLNIAQLLPEYSFLVPCSLDIVKATYGNSINYEALNNVDFRPMKWNTGLSQQVHNAKIVLNPSLWSAPVEGALIKSIKFNGVVACFAGEYSYCAELPDNVVIKLKRNNIMHISDTLRQVMTNKALLNDIRCSANEWIVKFLDQEKVLIHQLEGVIQKQRPTIM